ncbi:MAG: hypothetical protein AAFY38_10370 [Pseudomonadota bacterium]
MSNQFNILSDQPPGTSSYITREKTSRDGFDPVTAHGDFDQRRKVANTAYTNGDAQAWLAALPEYMYVKRNFRTNRFDHFSRSVGMPIVSPEFRDIVAEHAGSSVYFKKLELRNPADPSEIREHFWMLPPKLRVIDVQKSSGVGESPAGNQIAIFTLKRNCMVILDPAVPLPELFWDERCYSELIVSGKIYSALKRLKPALRLWDCEVRQDGS